MNESVDEQPREETANKVVTSKKKYFKGSKKAKAEKQIYFMPDQSISVEASSVDEAVAKANKVTTNEDKEEDGDA